ncbi:unnamed protein product, partial [Meganyctiphanes norvegica]
MIVAGKYYIRTQRPVGSGHPFNRFCHTAPASVDMTPSASSTTPDGKRKSVQELPSSAYPTGPFKRRRSWAASANRLSPDEYKSSSLGCELSDSVSNRGPFIILQRSPSSKINGSNTVDNTKLLDSECCGDDSEANKQEEVQDDLMAWLMGAMKARMDDGLIVHLLAQHFYLHEVHQARNLLTSRGYSLSCMKGVRGLLQEMLTAIRNTQDPNNNEDVKKLPRFVPRDLNNRPCVRPVPSDCVIEDLECLISSVVKLTTGLCWKLPEARHYSQAMEDSGTGSLGKQLSEASEALARLKTIIDWEMRTTRTLSTPMPPSSDQRPRYGMAPTSESHKVTWSNTFPPWGAHQTEPFLHPMDNIRSEHTPDSSPNRLTPPGVSPSPPTPSPTKLTPPGVSPSPSPRRVLAQPLFLTNEVSLAHLSPGAPPLSPLSLPSPRTSISPSLTLPLTTSNNLSVSTIALPGTPTTTLPSPVALNSPNLDIQFGEITENCFSPRTRKIKAPTNVNAAEFKPKAQYHCHISNPTSDPQPTVEVNPVSIKCKKSEGAADLKITTPHPPQRPWIPVGQPDRTKPSCIFTVLCYNVLCDKYATRQMYGYCPSWALEWEYRKKGIMDEIRNLCADIITLQEVETDQFYNFFLPELKADGYDGIFSPKSRAKHMAENERKFVDGCAIFWRTTKFSLVKDHLVEFNKLAMANHDGSEDMLNRVMTKDNIGLAALLETREAAWENSSVMPNKNQISQPVLVCTAHVHWDPEFCDVKLIQTIFRLDPLKGIITK